MIRYPDGQLFLRTLLWKQWLHGSGKSQKVHTWYVECTKNNGPKDTSLDTFFMFSHNISLSLQLKANNYVSIMQFEFLKEYNADND